MAAGELWDVTDAQGVPTGATHRRGAPDWPTGRYHVVASTCVVGHDGRVLVTKRAAAKDHAGLWEIPAGSALAGERSVEAAVRELREETGVAVSAASLRPVGRFVEETALFDLYVARAPAGCRLELDPQEVSDAEWETLAEVGRRWHDAELAAPWNDRLVVLWEPLEAAVTALGDCENAENRTQIAF